MAPDGVDDQLNSSTTRAALNRFVPGFASGADRQVSKRDQGAMPLRGKPRKLVVVFIASSSPGFE